MLPHAGVQFVRVEGVDLDVRATGFLVHVEDFIPALATIGGFEDTALLVFTPQRPQRSGVGNPGLIRVQGDAVDPFRILQADALPALSTIYGLEHAAADRGGVSYIAFSRTDPDDVRV